METSAISKRRLIALAALGLTVMSGFGALSAGCGKKPAGEQAASGGGEGGGGGAGAPGQAAAEQRTPVIVTPAAQQTVTKSVPVTGSVTALQSVSLTPKQTARVVSVAGREGSAVKAGEVVVQQETSDLQNQLETALANLQSAKAKVTQAETNYRMQTVQSATGVQNARAALASAQAALALAKQPQRTEQIQQAEIAVQQAEANYKQAQADRNRYEYLVKEGAAAAQTLEQYRTNEQVQLATLNTAKQSLKIAQTGGRTEQIRQSEEQVRQAQAALRQAQANVQQNEARRDDIRQAEAAVAQYQAQVDIARKAVADASIKSPIDGVISVRATEPGQMATAGGASVMTIVSLKTVYFQAQVPETQFGSLKQGQSVEVTVDAFPGHVFRGKVTQLYPTGSTSSRTFNVRVDIPNDSGALKPGMFARGEVVLDRRPGVVIPKDALVAANSEGTKFQVYVATNGGTKAERRPVTVGVRTPTTVEIVSGVKAGDQVVTTGQDGLRDGAAIRIETGGSTEQQQQQAAALAK